MDLIYADWLFTRSDNLTRIRTYQPVINAFEIQSFQKKSSRGLRNFRRFSQTLILSSSQKPVYALFVSALTFSFLGSFELLEILKKGTLQALGKVEIKDHTKIRLVLQFRFFFPH